MATRSVDEIINPKKTLKRRESEAENEEAMAAARARTILDGGIRFEKGRTKEERDEAQRKLVEMLKKRK